MILIDFALNVINFVDMQVYLVMEKYDGDLQSLLNESKNQSLSETEQIDAMQ